MEAWNAFLRSLESRFGEQPIRKWVRPLKIVNYDACNLYLEAENSFQAAWFEEHIRPLLKKEFFNNNARPIQVHLEQKAKLKRKAAQQAASMPMHEIKPDLIDSAMTFSNFIFDNQNEMTVDFLRNLSPGAFNPLFLWGQKGIGKSHLLHAVANKLQAQGLSVFYVHCETFTQHVVEAIRVSQMRSFREIYRNQDVLIVDDIHLLARRNATQEEFFHTFNTLHTSGKQILLCSHLLPSQMVDIEPRLISRFEWGIVLDLLPLSPHKMELVLKNKARLHHFPLNDDVAQFLISSFSTSPKSMMRGLEALMLRHRSESELQLELAEHLLEDLLEQEKKATLSPEKIVSIAAEYFGIRTEDIMGRSQAKECANPRKLAMYLCRKHLSLSYQSIGRYFDRDHSTVMTAVQQIQKKSGSDEIEAALIDLETAIKS